MTKQEKKTAKAAALIRDILATLPEGEREIAIEVALLALKEGEIQ